MHNWENLRYYLAVAKRGTVSAAASELGVSHATVLRRIEQMENELGTLLFKKLQSGYELTVAGEKLLVNAEKVEMDIHEMERQFQGQQEQSGGLLRVSQPESDILDLFTHYAEFSREHPEFTLEVHSTMDVESLDRHEVDVAIRVTENPPDLLVGRCLGRIGYGAYASDEYLSGFKKPYNLSEFNWILWHIPPGDRQSRLRELKVEDPNIVLFTTRMSDVISAVRVGMGVGLISHHIARLYPDLVAIPDTDGANNYPVWLLTHRDLRNSARVRTFMRFMASALKGQFVPPLNRQ